MGRSSERIEIGEDFPNLEGKAVRVRKKKTKSKKKGVSTGKKRSQGKKLSARGRARVLCRIMELRVSITRYFLQEAQYMDRVRSRVALSLAAFNESTEMKYGKKLISALDTLALDRETPEELDKDLALLRQLESELELGTQRENDDDLPDDDLNELELCLQEDIDAINTSIARARQALAQLSNQLPKPPSSDCNGSSSKQRNYLRPPLPPASTSAALPTTPQSAAVAKTKVSSTARPSTNSSSAAANLNQHHHSSGGLVF